MSRDIERRGGDIERKGSSHLSLVDTLLTGAIVVGVVLVALWLLHAVAGFVLFLFKLAVLVVIVGLGVRIAHRLTRGRHRDH